MSDLYARYPRSAGLKQIEICDLAQFFGTTSSLIGRLFYGDHYDVQLTVDRDLVINALKRGMGRQDGPEITVVRQRPVKEDPSPAKRATTWDLKARVAARDLNLCRYCGKRLTREILAYDHVIPFAKGGQDTIENVVQACRSCNAEKAARLLQDTDLVLLPPGTTRAMLKKVVRFGVARWVLPQTKEL